MAGEIPNVVTGEVVSSDWGNDIRDRTIQRYATVAARSAAVPAPNAGDLSYLHDTDTVWVYNGSAWVKLTPAPVATADIATDAVGSGQIIAGGVGTSELAAGVAQNLFAIGGGEHTTPGALTTSFVDKATVAFTKPASWTNYRIVVQGFAYMTAIGGSVEARIEIGASNGTAMAPSSGDNSSVGCFHQVDTSTSPVTIALAARESAGSGNYEFSYVTYQAVRLT